ncbi:PREDICTED: trihelix transcription factor GTL2-like isoform X1 [Camelina sativa]|uniref:Trihelix transcription factor GTL2-like isoform X1 n=1 Tax=Camelina sativa TaxID=90675 RepID=A0ABM1QB62_CAMSA|nr:PREDICTED: trihelix transcription factor GTL2-like isoform X1 [Camelina sativa]
MFDGGVPEQIHRFIASPPPASPLPPHQSAAERSLPFPISFASYNTNHQAQHILSLDSRKIIHHHHHHHHHDIKDGGPTPAEWICHTDHDGDNHHHPWCSDEVLALLRFRSTVENWFPEFTWEHTSRKLAEVGFKRSPQECKEKFEDEERRYFNGNNNNNNTNDHQHISNYNNKGNNYRIFSEVEEFYQHGHDDEHVSSEVGDNQNKRNNSLERKRNVEETVQDLMEEDKLRDQDQGQVEEASMGNKINSINVGKVGNVEDDAKSSSSSSLMMIMREKKKRKRKKEKERFGVLKGFCEGLVRNMIAQQEEMHKKLLEDMVKTEEEKIAREEDWKKQEMERLNKEVEIRKQEQAMASDRNTNIIKFISKFTDQDLDVEIPTSAFHDPSSLALPQTQGRKKFQTSSSLLHQTLTPHNPLTNDNSLEPTSTKTLKTKTQNPKPPKSDDKSDLGKRWPKDEVLALINIRRSISSMNDDDHKDGNSLSSSSKAVPLWERISKKMLEVGYKRSAKRCKEKWENINKYFRKTKDVNKKRPLDSRTCPYFHQLTAMYSQPSTGTTITATATSAGDLQTRPEVGSEDPDIPAPMHVDADGAGDKSNVPFSGFDLEF